MKRKEFLQKSVLGAGAMLTHSYMKGDTMVSKDYSLGVVKPRYQVPGVQHTKVGEAIITTILDGYIDVLPEYWVNFSEKELRQALSQNFLNPNMPLRISVNAYLINTGNQLIAIDTGADAFFGPPAGKYAENIKAAGIDPKDIDIVLLTHMHPDHIGGLIAGGKTVFPNAKIIGNSIEHNYWMNKTHQSNAPDFAKPWFDAVQTMTEKYGERLSFFEGEKEVIPGIYAVNLYGHTPGHSGFVFTSGNESIFFWADITDQPAFQMNHPERTLVFDIDKKAGQKARMKAIELAASEKLQIAGSHVTFPSFGHVAKTPNGYHFIPSEWKYEL